MKRTRGPATTVTFTGLKVLSRCPSATIRMILHYLPYLHTSLMSYDSYPIKEDFLRAAQTQGFPVTDDLQDLVTG